MKHTHHSACRAQQRGVPPMIIDFLIQFGARQHDAHGAEVVYFDREAKRRLERYSGGIFGKLNEHLDSYAVLCNGHVVTTGCRYKRINRP